ncbi:MAG: hypothetical protein Hyperionvirus6_12 [Hyperionvirus sp.]|uniref:Leucine-rich repeat protein n=1 Tax=Hyperionvirus sp. TaxID=2487770 RepID=A0A3G5AAS6_9VIRU|nr:MAG: hypothetical protein Hyperionvirus6_12 [Hyperionvirus sp.]
MHHHIYQVPFHVLCEYLDLIELKNLANTNRSLKKLVYAAAEPVVEITKPRMGIILMKLCANVKLKASQPLKRVNDKMLNKLTRLTCLYLPSAPMLSKPVTNKGLSYLPYLTYLNLRKNNYITDKDLINLTSLQNLDLTDNKLITHIGITHLTNLSQLIIFNNDKINNFSIMHLTNLRCMAVSGNNFITDVGIASLLNLTNLEYRYCDNITDDGLGCLTNLIRLNFSSDKITNRSIGKLINLTSLDLNNNDSFNDEGLISLSKLTKLKINNNCGISNVGISKLKNLRELMLTNSHNITDQGIKNLTMLTKLSLYDDDQITDCGLSHLISLIELKILENSNIKGKCFPFLVNLKFLTIFKSSIADRYMIYLLKLQRICVSNCRYLTDVGINVLSNLKYIFLEGSIRGTKDGSSLGSYSDAAVISLPKLKEIRLKGDHDIDDKDMILSKRDVKIIEDDTFNCEKYFFNDNWLNMCYELYDDDE